MPIGATTLSHAHPPIFIPRVHHAVGVAAQSKRGLVIINTVHLQTDLPKYLSSPVLSWVYNYSPEPPSPTVYGNLSFVPMLWGQDDSSTFFTTIKSGPQYDHILSFNEPDMPKNEGGSQLSVPDAVSIWQTQIQPLKNLGYKLGAPAGPHPSFIADSVCSGQYSHRRSMALHFPLQLQKLHHRFPPRPFLWSLPRITNIPLRSAYELLVPANLADRVCISGGVDAGHDFRAQPDDCVL